MSPLAWWLLAAALGLLALLCAQLASSATLVLQLLDLYEATRRRGPLVGPRPRWVGQRRLWRLLSALCALCALGLVPVAVGLW